MDATFAAPDEGEWTAGLTLRGRGTKLQILDDDARGFPLGLAVAPDSIQEIALAGDSGVSGAGGLLLQTHLEQGR